MVLSLSRLRHPSCNNAVHELEQYVLQVMSAHQDSLYLMEYHRKHVLCFLREGVLCLADFFIDIGKLRELHYKQLKVIRRRKTQLITLIAYPLMKRSTDDIEILINSTGFRFTNSLSILRSQPCLNESLITLIVIFLKGKDLVLPYVVELFALGIILYFRLYP